jgi:hypothetical protein
LFEEILGFSLFRKRWTWNRCTHESWYGIKITTTPGWGGATGSAMDIGTALSTIAKEKYTFEKLRAPEHLCYIYIRSTQKKDQPEFEKNVFDACENLNFDIQATMKEVAAEDPQHRAGVVLVQRLRPVAGVDEENGEGEEAAHGGEDGNAGHGGDGDGGDGEGQLFGVQLRMKNIMDFDACQQERKKFTDGSEILKEFGLEAFIVLVSQSWGNCDAFPMIKRSQKGRNSFTECTMKFAFGSELMDHSSFGAIPYLLYPGDDKAQELSAHSNPGNDPYLLVIIPPAEEDLDSCVYAYQELASIFKVTERALKKGILGPAKKDYCNNYYDIFANIDGNSGGGGDDNDDGNGGDAHERAVVVSFRSQIDSRKAAHVLGSRAHPAKTGRNLNQDLDNMCRNPVLVDNTFFDSVLGNGAALIACAVHSPDSKMAFGARGMLGGALSSRNCPLCSHGNGDHKCTNTGLHTTTALPKKYNDVDSVTDVLRCKLMTLLTMVRHFGHRAKVEKAVFWLRVTQIKELYVLVDAVVLFAEKEFGDPPIRPEEECESEDEDEDEDEEHEGGESEAESEDERHDDSSEDYSSDDDSSDDDSSDDDSSDDDDNNNNNRQRNNEYTRNVKLYQVKVIEFKSLIKKLKKKLRGYRSSTVSAAVGSEAGIDTSGLGKLLPKMRSLFRDVLGKMSSSECCKDTKNALISAACVKSCSDVVRYRMEEIQAAIDDVFNYEFFDKARLSTVMLTANIEQPYVTQLAAFSEIYDELKRISETTIRAGTRGANNNIQVRWSGLFTQLNINGPSTETMRTQIKLIDPFFRMMKLIKRKAKIKVKDLVRIIKNPLMKKMNDKKIFSEIVEKVGEGRIRCSMFADTTPQRGCKLHAENNWSCKITVTFGMGLADMVNMILPGCKLDQATDAFKCAKDELLNVANVKLTNTNRFAKQKKTSGNIEKENRQRVLQCHGKHCIPILTAKISKCFPDGTAPAAAEEPADITCPDLQSKWRMVEVFSGALHFILGNVKPCDYFDRIPNLKGCTETKTIPASLADQGLCEKQCSFVYRVRDVLGIVMDDLFPPYRNKRGSCYAWQSTSAHLRLYHIPDDFCK